MAANKLASLYDRRIRNTRLNISTDGQLRIAVGERYCKI